MLWPLKETRLNLLGKEQYFPQNGTMYHMLNPCSMPVKQLNSYLHTTHSDTRENWLSILTTSLTLDLLSLDATSTSKGSCKKGRGVKIGKEGDGEEGGIGGAQGTK